MIYHCDPDDSETISSEFDREVDNNYYSMKEKLRLRKDTETDTEKDTD